MSEQVPGLEMPKGARWKITDSFRDTLPNEGEGEKMHFFRTFSVLEHKLTANREVEVFSPGDFVEVDGMKLTVVGYFGSDTTWESLKKVNYLRLDFGNESYFVKRTPGYTHITEDESKVARSFDEFNSLLKAQEVLNDVDGVSVVTPLFAYQDDEERTYIVSEWINGVSLQRYLTKTNQEDRNEFLRISKRYNEAAELLESTFLDVKPSNAFYDEVTDTIIFFDIQHNSVME